MNQDQNHIDELFRSGLENAGLTPPPGVWEAVSGQVAGQAAGAGATATLASVMKSAWVWLAVSAAVITGITVYVINQPETAQKEEGLTREIGTLSRERAENVRTESNADENSTGEKVSSAAPDQKLPGWQQQSDRQDNHSPVSTAIDAEGQAGQPEHQKPQISNPDHTQVHPHTPVPTPGPVVRQPISPPADCPHRLNIQAEQREPSQWYFSAEGASGPVTWYFGDGQTATGNPVLHSYPQTTSNYIAKAVSGSLGGCTDSAFVPVSVIIAGKKEVFIPDFLTPNDDGINDELMVTIGETAEYSLLIFDRFSRQVFSSNNPAKSWNGRCGQIDCEPGTYTVLLTYRLRGESQKESIKKAIILKRSEH